MLSIESSEAPTPLVIGILMLTVEKLSTLAVRSGLLMSVVVFCSSVPSEKSYESSIVSKCFCSVDIGILFKCLFRVFIGVALIWSC